MREISLPPSFGAIGQRRGVFGSKVKPTAALETQNSDVTISGAVNAEATRTLALPTVLSLTL